MRHNEELAEALSDAIIFTIRTLSNETSHPISIKGAQSLLSSSILRLLEEPVEDDTPEQKFNIIYTIDDALTGQKTHRNSVTVNAASESEAREQFEDLFKEVKTLTRRLQIEEISCLGGDE